MALVAMLHYQFASAGIECEEHTRFVHYFNFPPDTLDAIYVPAIWRLIDCHRGLDSSRAVNPLGASPRRGSRTILDRLPSSPFDNGLNGHGVMSTKDRRSPRTESDPINKGGSSPSWEVSPPSLVRRFWSSGKLLFADDSTIAPVGCAGGQLLSNILFRLISAKWRGCQQDSRGLSIHEHGLPTPLSLKSGSWAEIDENTVDCMS